MKELTLKDFQQNYFYKTQLIQICRHYQLPTAGTKAELNSYLKQYLSGTPAVAIKPYRRVHKQQPLKRNQMTLQTKLVDSGFSFNEEARAYFAQYFGVKHFVFKKPMAIMKRDAERRHDLTVTIADLIACYQNSQKQPADLSHVLTNNAEEQTYQWNNFVKDFCASPVSHHYSQKLKVAGILWQHLKKSSGKKNFYNDLIKRYARELKPYVKHS